MTSTVKPTKAKALAGVLALIAGTQKHFPNGTFTIGNATLTAPALIGILQGLADAMAKENDAKAAAKDALTALRAEKARANPVVQGFRDLLLAMFGNATQTLADFGLAPHKARTPLTVNEKAAAKAKRTATREARGTKGPKAKLAIKGTVPAEPHAPPAATPAKPAV
jgi:hypothetical protein